MGIKLLFQEILVFAPCMYPVLVYPTGGVGGHVAERETAFATAGGCRVGFGGPCLWRSSDWVYQDWVHRGSKNKDLRNQETNPKGHWGSSYFFRKYLFLLPPCTQSWYTQPEVWVGMWPSVRPPSPRPVVAGWVFGGPCLWRS